MATACGVIQYKMITANTDSSYPWNKYLTFTAATGAVVIYPKDDNYVKTWVQVA
jgi:hypothetical protein